MFQPENLRLARERRGFRKTDLAKKLGVSSQLIAYYESGDRDPTVDRLHDLSAALDFPLAFFSLEDVERVPVDAFSFRSLSRMTHAQRDAAIAVGSIGVRFSKWIDTKFELAESNVLDAPSGLVDSESASASMRSLWGLGDLPIDNLLNVAEMNGLRVFNLPLDHREVDAFSFWHSGSAFVFVSNLKTAERRVFDLAHEIGHLVLHRGHAAPRGRKEELEADRFASSLLMPRDDVLAHAPRYPTFDQLVTSKHRWKVSVAALNFRMHQLGMTSEYHYRELCIEISRHGRALEPSSLPFPYSYVLTTVLGLMRQEGMSRAQIAEQIGISPSELNGLVDSVTFSAISGGADGTARTGALRLV